MYHQLQKNPSCSRFMIPFIGGPCHSIYTYWFGATFITSFSSPRPNRARIGGIHPLQTRFQRTNDWLEIQAVEVVSPIKKTGDLPAFSPCEFAGQSLIGGDQISDSYGDLNPPNWVQRGHMFGPTQRSRALLICVDMFLFHHPSDQLIIQEI